MKRKLCSLCLMAAIVLSLCPASVRAETEKLKAVQEMEISQETEESEEVGAADLDSWNSEEELMVFGLSDLDLEEDGRLRLASVYDWDGMVQNTVNWMRGSGAQVMNSTFCRKSAVRLRIGMHFVWDVWGFLTITVAFWPRRIPTSGRNIPRILLTD